VIDPPEKLGRAASNLSSGWPSRSCGGLTSGPLSVVEAAHPQKSWIHVHLDNASYHHAKRLREWLKRQGRKCVLHFIPPYCPHLDPIERCWGLMHQYTTHNRDYKTFDQFRAAILTFLNQTISKKWEHFCDRINDNFRVISPADFRIVA
jgi:transposase